MGELHVAIRFSRAGGISAATTAIRAAGWNGSCMLICGNNMLAGSLTSFEREVFPKLHEEDDTTKSYKLV
jgi:hypothetical protein